MTNNTFKFGDLVVSAKGHGNVLWRVDAVHDAKGEYIGVCKTTTKYDPKRRLSWRRATEFRIAEPNKEA